MSSLSTNFTNFFFLKKIYISDQEGAAYFGELEAALMHGVAGIRSDEDRKRRFLTPLSLPLSA